MNTLAADKVEETVLACSVRFTKTMMYISVADGREIGVPLEWFARLKNASARQLRNWRLIGNGIGIHWDELDEDISVEELFLNGERKPKNRHKQAYSFLRE